MIDENGNRLGWFINKDHQIRVTAYWGTWDQTRRNAYLNPKSSFEARVMLFPLNWEIVLC